MKFKYCCLIVAINALGIGSGFADSPQHDTHGHHPITTDALPSYEAVAPAEQTLEQPLPSLDAQTYGEAPAPVATEPVPDTPAAASEATLAPQETAAPPEVLPDLWQRIRDGFALGEIDSPLVDRHITQFAAAPDYVARIVERSRRYLYHIVEEVENRGMPSEIALLPIVESAFNPKAYSRAHASGIWQFVPATGKHYGLDQNWWYDGRRDIIAATAAALDYLQALHNRFGDWHLAMAAYNCGEGNVSRAIARNRAAGLRTDFSSLSLPRETRHYVPKLLAVRSIVAQPELYGLSLARIPNEPYFVAVSTTKHIDVEKAAQFAEVSMQEFLDLNPAYNRPVITAHQEQLILVPAEKAEFFKANLENPDQSLLSWRAFKLQRGVAFDKIAGSFGMTSAELKRVNGIAQHKRLAGGGTILVPVSEADKDHGHLPQHMHPEAYVAAPPPPAPPALRHRVGRGDTLLSIARRYGVTTSQVANWNRLRSKRVLLGQTLTIHRSSRWAPRQVSVATKPHFVSAAARANHSYVVKRGDTLYGIARRFNVAVADLQRWNRLLKGRRLLAGSRVTILSERPVGG